MPPTPKQDKTHLDKMLEGVDKVFRKGVNNPDTPKEAPKPDDKDKSSNTPYPPRR